ncbi:hypothetical protein GCM10023321_13370 [Pseudonocardia eucalypti]|uniref:Nudix hydrolase domain-containing protein n=1 Tax=Pseudonocardia eucalypti TaxID=648755 RepID=A0ABP9PN95_9PSEU|nr:ADP-ribose pyrophosphatase YjhB (NUDIX family) [Pseudonocardia eucalypti]
MTAPGGSGLSSAERVFGEVAESVLDQVGRDRVFVAAATTNRQALKRKVAEGLALCRASGRTPQNTFVYAVIYDSNGNFLLFRKNTKGYFFKGKALSTSGQDLHGGDNWTLPGGGLDEVKKIAKRGKITRAVILAGAKREFREETGFELAGLNLPARAGCWQDRGCVYTAGYFQAEQRLSAIRVSATQRLDAGRRAAQAVASGNIRQSSDIRAYPNCENAPLDNELSDGVETWNVKDCWSEIEPWKQNKHINWFANILEHLKNTVIRT